MGSYDKVTINFFKALTIVYKMTVLVFKLELFSYFHVVNLFDPCDPYMTFNAKLLLIL